jgi:hypothetical protein
MAGTPGSKFVNESAQRPLPKIPNIDNLRMSIAMKGLNKVYIDPTVRSSFSAAADSLVSSFPASLMFSQPTPMNPTLATRNLGHGGEAR